MRSVWACVCAVVVHGRAFPLRHCSVPLSGERFNSEYTYLGALERHKATEALEGHIVNRFDFPEISF